MFHEHTNNRQLVFIDDEEIRVKPIKSTYLSSNGRKLVLWSNVLIVVFPRTTTFSRVTRRYESSRFIFDINFFFYVSFFK